MNLASVVGRLLLLGGFVRLSGGGEIGARAEDSLLAPTAIVADRYVTPDGTVSDVVVLTLSDGKIEAVLAAKELPSGGRVARFEGAVICPGLIDVRSSAGAYGNTVESALSIDPGVSAVDSWDPHHRDFRRALVSGITTVVIAPSPTNVVAGCCVAVKTGGAKSPTRSVLRDDGPLVFGFGRTTWKYDREPTSRIGAMAMLRSVLEDAQGGTGHPRLRSIVSGRLDALLYCDDAMDVSAALRLFESLPTRIAIVHTSDVYDLAEELARSNATVVVGPYSFSTGRRTLAMAGVLARAGVEVALAGNMPVEGGHALRQTAALAVRYGMQPEPARRAMTIHAAKAAGVSDHVGAIREGMDADLVVFSGDPLRMDSRVLAVYINGVRVYSADQEFTLLTGTKP